VSAFDICGELPSGTTVLEASAGTGKTFTIAALATRYVAEGHVDLSQLMLVTFSRAATQELRDRVRERLVSAERGLAHSAAARSQADDALLRLLADAPDEEVAVRRRRLTRALAGFDAATIATTHGFCQQMLAGLGTAGDTDRDATFVESIDDLITEVVDDLYLRKFAPIGTAAPAVAYTCARKVAGQAVADSTARLVAHDPGGDAEAYQRYGLADAVRREVDARKRARRLLDYDDLLTRLRDALVDPARGAAARARVRERYRVVLVDEFQDTDPVQWEILRAAFHGSTTLVLIGDPKQAIYAFRGADLVTYLAAAGEAATRRTLARNWRSDAALVTALETVFRGAALGDSRIVVRPVEAAHAVRRLAGPPLRLRIARRSQGPLSQRGLLLADGARQLVAADLAADIARTLAAPAGLTLDGAARQLRPGHIAVLVRKNDQAVLVRDALREAGVPAVLTGTISVFLSRPAREWLTLLRALEAPHRAGLLRAAALTSFVGWTAERLATEGDDGVDRLGLQVRGWRDVLTERGVAALLEVVTTSTGLTERLLATLTGERDLTDLRHIGQALHEAAVVGQLGPAALAEWLQRRVKEAGEDQSEERSRRLESDADAVQVVTVHGSKGLQFPVVYLPFAWDRHVFAKPEPLLLHDPDGTRRIDVGGSTGAGYRERSAAHQAEESGEDLRLLYVAMTRAQCQVVTWWAPSSNTPASALHRLVFGEFAAGESPPDTVDVSSDDEARRRLEKLAAGSGGCIVLEPVDDSPSAYWRPPVAPLPPLEAARFARSLDAAWRRTSYTGLTSVAYESPGVGSEPEDPERQDEATVPPLLPADTGDDERLRAVASPMADLPTGTAFGTLVHAVLETIDTSAADPAGELRDRCEEAVSARLGAAVDAGTLATALMPVLETPLGPLADGVRLWDVVPKDRLAELDFELPLAGGDEPRSGDATLRDIAALLRRHLPATDPLAGYPDLLDGPLLGEQRLRGYLTGSLDAVLRLRNADGDPRYAVVDYKTNWLGDFGPAGPDPLTAWHYRPAALAAAMRHAHYPLQALLYAVALHRFLRWRQPAYHPDRHLGGVLYLFVRGMSGPSTPLVGGEPCGVFSWRPAAALVEDLSALLDRGAR
jgi:exodeoxyribonuclease V beta subunit